MKIVDLLDVSVDFFVLVFPRKMARKNRGKLSCLQLELFYLQLTISAFLLTIGASLLTALLPLAITAFGSPEGYSSLAIIAFGAFELIVPRSFLLGKSDKRSLESLI